MVEGMVWRMTRGGEQWLVSPLARTVVRGTDCRHPGDVRTTGRDAGAVMVLRTHEEIMMYLCFFTERTFIIEYSACIFAKIDSFFNGTLLRMLPSTQL